MENLIIAIIAILSATINTKEHQSTDIEIITVLQTADIHAYLNPHSELYVENDSIIFRNAGGLATIKSMVDEIKKENPMGTLLIDGGDFIQGSGASVRSKGNIFPSIVKAMNYDLLIPGNWEVIYGKEVMLNIMNSYQTQVIAANMFDEQDQSTLFPPYWVKTIKGVRIGFIAYNDPEIPERQNPGYSKSMKFTPVEQNLKSLVTKVKNEEKVDILFLVTHLGISKQLLLADNPAVKGVDFILGNDTHERIRKPIEGKYTKVVEPGAFGSFLGKLDLEIKDKKMIGYNYELLDVSPEKYPEDTSLQEIIDHELAPYEEEMQTILGFTSKPIYRYLVVENPMDNFITDALLWKTGVDFATSNGFRFGVPIVPDTSGKAAITKGDLWRMLPVDEHMKIGKVTGHQVKDWLENEINNVFATDYQERFGGWLVRFSGLTMQFDSSKEKGNRIMAITIQGEPLELDKVYKMASCNRTGEPISTMCRLKDATEVSIQDYSLHDAVSEYLKEKKIVNPTLDGRSVAVDLGTNAFSQMEEGNYKFR
ncbi:bifunctional metallophosphatase/5'-nucleotidase [Belliella sp. DSM 107340]|uniref:Bifunctional metallophosphatase/5'-nucleotidase n=1 Tax=Belliella calami TaxID=2923436 RepID=A0ABS9UU63_9BACT|nr:bifunctional metallophosphatase/5'-nucleotidase [Belliella calami]MCH7400039.1 bifunctional metallophosphatase/5'-nucleotidase [Belliella calami]